MAKIAISGGIGAGKSRLAEALRARGEQVLDSDALARQCLDSADIRSNVIASFPTLRSISEQDFRKELAKIVFADPSSLKILESIIHPCVSEKIRNAELAQIAPLFVEVPVLAAALTYDFLITVIAPEEIRIERLRKKGMDDQDIYDRIASQPSEAQFISNADFIFNGNGDEESYDKSVTDLLAEIGGLLND